MVRIRLWAIGIGEVREIFGAPSEVAAARLAELTPPAVTSPRAPGLLGKLGPLLRRASDAPVIPADQPTRADAEALLKGSFIVPNRLPAGLEKLREQQAAGRRCVLVSASPELFLRPWAEALGFSHVIATQLEEADGRCTGRLGSANCYGAEKVRRIEAQLGPGAWTDSWAFGDSRADLPMLRASGRGFLRRGEHFDPVS